MAIKRKQSLFFFFLFWGVLKTLNCLEADHYYAPVSKELTLLEGNLDDDVKLWWSLLGGS